MTTATRMERRAIMETFVKFLGSEFQEVSPEPALSYHFIELGLVNS